MSAIEKLTQTVNQSGFPLQLGVANLVSRNGHGWTVLSTEHAWKDEIDSSSGFIDLVLEDRYRTSILVVECKRVLESSWIFLREREKDMRGDRRHAKLWITETTAHDTNTFGWADVALDPPSPESAYCVVPGQDAKSKPMLERTAGEIVVATEALASEERPLLQLQRLNLRMYASLIVTTATLQVCDLDSERIQMDTGTVPEASFSEVPFVRFRKQLSSRAIQVMPEHKEGLSSLAKSKEHTVFVANVAALDQFLERWSVENSSLLRSLQHRP